MKRTIFTLAALLALSASPALAASIDEVARETNTPVNVIAAPQREAKGYGNLVTSETEDLATPAQSGPVAIVDYPADERPKFTRGR